MNNGLSSIKLQATHGGLGMHWDWMGYRLTLDQQIKVKPAEAAAAQDLKVETSAGQNSFWPRPKFGPLDWYIILANKLYVYLMYVDVMICHEYPCILFQETVEWCWVHILIYIYIYIYFYNFYRCQKFPSSGGLGAFGGRSTASGCAATDFVQDGATQADAEGGGVRQCQETLTRSTQTLITDNSPLSIGLWLLEEYPPN